MALILTAEQTAHLLFWDTFEDSQLRPLRLSDGRYALNENVLNDRRHARWQHILKAGSVESLSGLSFDPPFSGRAFSLFVDGKEMALFADFSPGRFDITAPDTYRFECRRGDRGYQPDPENGRRRSELVSNGEDAYPGGTVLRSEWKTTLTDNRGAFLEDGGPIIHQWHSYDNVSGSRSPVMVLALDNGNLQVRTRSDDAVYPDNLVMHYEEPFNPDSGVPVDFVVEGVLGKDGHLSVWMDGIQIVDVDVSIGYYNDYDPPGDGPIAYPQWGMYMSNNVTSDVDVIYHSHIKWGPVNLPSLAYDDFNRSDSTSSAGTTSVGGKAWTTNGTVIAGISSNRFYFPTVTTVGGATVSQSGVKRVKAKLDTPAASGAGGLEFWTTDASNKYLLALRQNGSTLRYTMFRRSAGSNVQLSTSSVTPAAGDEIQLDINDSTKNFAVRVNGTQIINVTDATPLTKTDNFGFYTQTGADANTVRWDNFELLG